MPKEVTVAYTLDIARVAVVVSTDDGVVGVNIYFLFPYYLFTFSLARIIDQRDNLFFFNICG